MLDDSDLKFDIDRTPVDLKDRYDDLFVALQPLC